MARKDSIAIVETFWREVWQAPQNPGAIDRLVAEDFIVTSGGHEIQGREAFKNGSSIFNPKFSISNSNLLKPSRTKMEVALHPGGVSRERTTGFWELRQVMNPF